MQVGFTRFNMNGTKEVRAIMSKSKKKENPNINNVKLSFCANSI
jgi:fructose/tagatose bisphosphate aldolase